MKINITVHRSKEWVARQRQATGENTPDHIECPVEVGDLSEMARKILLEAGGGKYATVDKLRFNREYELVCGDWSAFGWVEFQIDSDSPTPEMIDAAIVHAADQVGMKKIEDARRRLEEEARAAEEKRQREAKDAEEKRQREAWAAEIAKAREICAKELDRLDRLEEDCNTLSEFIYNIPADAKRGALRRMAAANTEEAVKNLHDRIENAATIYVLNDLNDDEG